MDLEITSMTAAKFPPLPPLCEDSTSLGSEDSIEFGAELI
jgi:hypothetical protein